MNSRNAPARFPDEQPTLGRHVISARLLALCVWLIGLSALIMAWATGTALWHAVELVVYLAVLPLGVLLSTALRARQRKLDSLWARRLRDLAVRDDLTGLYNRRHFHAELQRLTAESLSAGRPLSVAFVDLNDFKAVNDTHGHEAGDLALCSVAQCLLALVGDRGIVARTGGDEFGVLLPGMSEADAHTLFGPACRTLPVPVPGSTPFTIDGTVGIASLDGDADAGQLLRRADDRLYEKKRARDRQCRVA